MLKKSMQQKNIKDIATKTTTRMKDTKTTIKEEAGKTHL